MIRLYLESHWIDKSSSQRLLGDNDGDIDDSDGDEKNHIYIYI